MHHRKAPQLFPATLPLFFTPRSVLRALGFPALHRAAARRVTLRHAERNFFTNRLTAFGDALESATAGFSGRLFRAANLPVAEVFTKKKRFQVMAAIRSTGNRATELRLAAIFQEHGITGWRRH